MNEIWTNRLAAGTKTWGELPPARRSAVKALLAARVESGDLTTQRYQEITGEDWEV